MRFSFPCKVALSAPFALLLGAGFAWGQTAAPPTPSLLPAPSMVAPDVVVLTVGDTKITKAQFDLILATLPDQQRAMAQTPKGRHDLAERLAEILTLANAARAQKFDQTPKAQMQILLTTDQLLANIMYRDLAENTKPDDAMLKAYYEAHKSEWEEVKAQHILIRFQGSKMPLAAGKRDLTDAEALAKITELRAKIVAGADFGAVAKESSDDTTSGANGGELGAFGRGKMIPEFEKEAFVLPVGQVSQPVKSAYGYHLIKVESHSAKPFEEVKAEIAKRMPEEIAKKGLDALKAKNPPVLNDAYFK